MEISLRHQLPNFWECWWDSFVLDVLICNGGGIFLGWLTCRAFEMKQYYWGMGKDSRTENERFSSCQDQPCSLLLIRGRYTNGKFFVKQKLCNNFVVYRIYKLGGPQPFLFEIFAVDST
jgi:Phosphatidyl serine synthase.